MTSLFMQKGQQDSNLLDINIRLWLESQQRDQYINLFIRVPVMGHESKIKWRMVGMGKFEDY